MSLLNGLFSGSRPNSPGTSTTPRGAKRPAVDMGVDVSINDLFRFCLKLRNDLDQQCEYSRGLEEKLRELTAKVDSLPVPLTVPPSVSLPPPPNGEIPTVTVDDDMTGNSSHSNGTPEPVPKAPVTTSISPIENPSDHERSIVIARLPSDPTQSLEQQVRDDYDQVVSISSLIGYPVLPIAVYRMPPRDVNATHIRLTKVVLPTRQHAQLMVKNASRVARDPHFRDIYIRPSFPNKDDERRKTPRPRSGMNAPRRDYGISSNIRPETILPRSRLNSQMTSTSRLSRNDRPRDSHPHNQNRPHIQRYPPPSFPQFPPRPLFDNVTVGFPSQSSLPFPSQFAYPNPYMSFVSQYGAPPHMGMQGNW